MKGPFLDYSIQQYDRQRSTAGYRGTLHWELITPRLHDEADIK